MAPVSLRISFSAMEVAQYIGSLLSVQWRAIYSIAEGYHTACDGPSCSIIEGVKYSGGLSRSTVWSNRELQWKVRSTVEGCHR